MLAPCPVDRVEFGPEGLQTAALAKVALRKDGNSGNLTNVVAMILSGLGLSRKTHTRRHGHVRVQWAFQMLGTMFPTNS